MANPAWSTLENSVATPAIYAFFQKKPHPAILILP